MGIVAIRALGTFVDHKKVGSNTFVTRRGDALAHLILVVMRSWITPQPAVVDLDMSKTTELVIVVVSLGAPCGTELASLVMTHLT